MSDKTFTFTANELWSLIDKLMGAAGKLSDVQEFGCSDFANGAMNAAKSDIFDVIEKLDPRR
jgi:hypothetical protein